MGDRGSFPLGKVVDLATGKLGTDDLVIRSRRPASACPT
jgi:hypothetical protein